MNDTTRQLLTLLRKIRLDIYSALKELHSSDPSYEEYHSDPHSDQPEIKGETLAAVEAMRIAKETAEAKKYALDHRRYRLEWKGYHLSKIAGASLLAYTIITAIIAVYSVTASNAAKKSADTAATELRVSERPWVGINSKGSGFDQKLNEPIVVQFSVTNSGKTPAIETHGTFVAEILIGNEPMKKAPSATFGPRALVAGQEVTMPMPLLQLVTGKPIILDRPLEEQFEKGTAYFLMSAKVEYTDIFGVSHWTKFCTTGGPNLTSRTTTHSSEAEDKCDRYNDVDRNF